MTKSFDYLTPDNDVPRSDICNDCAAEIAAEMAAASDEPLCDPAVCASYTEEEHEAIMDQARDLGDALYEALNAFSETHPEMSYDVILHALDCMVYCIKAQMHEDSADA